jgi:uncharacterized protein
MTFEVYRAERHERRPWRNGGGMTAEVAAWPPDSDADSEFDWRVSFAEVSESGPFSLFPGVDRSIMVVEGPGMTLHLPGANAVALLPYRPFAFDGGLEVSCTVLGSTRDLNVMARRGRASATIEVLDRRVTDPPTRLDPADPLLVVALLGDLTASAAMNTVQLHPGDVLASDEPLVVEGHGRGAVVPVRHGVPPTR